MIIQSRIQQMRQTAASSAWTDDEADDDPWSGYGDTLEMELNTAPAQAATTTTATATPTPTPAPATQTYTQTVEASACADQVDEFAAAGARLQQRGQDLHQQHLRSPRRQVPQYFAHLEQGYGYGVAGRGYAPTHYYTPSPAPVQYVPQYHHQPPHHVPPASSVPQVITMEPDPLAPQQPALPYEIDAYGNPILPEGMELDAWGNLIPSNDYYRS
jgi:hypothetical protein